MPEARPDTEIATALGQVAVVRAGDGTGVLLDFMAAEDADLVRISPERRTSREYWTVGQEDLAPARRIIATTETLTRMVRIKRSLFMPP